MSAPSSKKGVALDRHGIHELESCHGTPTVSMCNSPRVSQFQRGVTAPKFMDSMFVECHPFFGRRSRHLPNVSTGRCSGDCARLNFVYDGTRGTNYKNVQLPILSSIHKCTQQMFRVYARKWVHLVLPWVHWVHWGTWWVHPDTFWVNLGTFEGTFAFPCISTFQHLEKTTMCSSLGVSLRPML